VNQGRWLSIAASRRWAEGLAFYPDTLDNPCILDNRNRSPPCNKVVVSLKLSVRSWKEMKESVL
jgi:hypothetical protein